MRNFVFRVLLIEIAFILSFSSLFAQEVETKSGILKGVIEEDLIVFKGIPYAAAPVGELRWRAPQPAESWSGIRLADKFSPIPFQNGMYPKDSPKEEMSEDCLYLNIWKPKDPKPNKLPVMLWIYGGGLVNGSASNALYSGSKLAKQDVIVVTANYRLGLMGFLAHPELSEEASYKSSGNYGLLDMIAALRWIQENIEAFGGDPNNVTIFGQSSGAISISVLIASPLARGLFHKAIAQSGGLFEPIELDPGFSLESREQSGVKFAERIGVASIKELRNIAAEELMKVRVRTSMAADNYVLKQSAFDAYRNNEYNKVPLLLGNTLDEGQEFIEDLNITHDTYEEELEKHFPGWAIWLTAPDPGNTDEDAKKAAIAFESDIRFKWDMWTWAHLASKDKSNKVFVYQFTKSPPFPEDSAPAGWGAVHGSDLFYVFGQLQESNWNWTANDSVLSATMVNYWTNFAKYGDPNGVGLLHWPAFTPDKPEALYFDDDITVSILQPDDTILKIDRVYKLARWIMQHYVTLLFFGLLLLIAIIVSIFKVVRNRKKQIK